MKWHEVAPDVSLTQHAITIRPLCFSAKTFRKLPKELQDAIVKAGVEAGAYGRDWERREDEKIMEKMKAEGKVRIHPFTERAKLLDLVAPVKVAFAKEAGADKVLEGINAVK
jgi:TRAP-type transport system periplasmic protein